MPVLPVNLYGHRKPEAGWQGVTSKRWHTCATSQNYLPSVSILHLRTRSKVKPAHAPPIRQSTPENTIKHIRTCLECLPLRSSVADAQQKKIFASLYTNIRYASMGYDLRNIKLHGYYVMQLASGREEAKMSPKKKTSALGLDDIYQA